MLQIWPDTKLSHIQIRVFRVLRVTRVAEMLPKLVCAEYSLAFQILACCCIKWKDTYQSQCKEKEWGIFPPCEDVAVDGVLFGGFPLTLAHRSGTRAEIRQITKMSGFDGMLNSREKWEVGWGVKVRPHPKAFKIPNCKNQIKLENTLEVTPIFKPNVACGILDTISRLEKEWSYGLSKEPVILKGQVFRTMIPNCLDQDLISGTVFVLYL